MKQAITILALLLLSSPFVEAQSYITAGGLRVGGGIGLTVQQRLTKRLTVEGIIQTQSKRNEVMATALLERHIPIITKHFNIYGGAGLHKGWSTTALREATYVNPFGVTFVGGIEMTLGRINLSYDFKPAINFVGGEQFIYPQSAISVRYVLIKDNLFDKKKKNKKKKKKKNEGVNWKFWED